MEDKNLKMIIEPISLDFDDEEPVNDVFPEDREDSVEGAMSFDPELDGDVFWTSGCNTAENQGTEEYVQENAGTEKNEQNAEQTQVQLRFTGKPDFGDVRKLISEAKQADGDLCAISSYSLDAALVKELFSAIKSDAVESRMRKLPVSYVNRDKSGIRVSALSNAGFTNVYQLMNMTSGKLQNIDGIGPDSAYKIVSSCKRIKKDLEKEPVVLSEHIKNRNAKKLFRLIYIDRAILDCRVKSEELYNLTHPDIEQLLDRAKKAKNSLRWALSRSEEKSSAIKALNILDTNLNGGYGKSCRKYRQAYDTAMDVDYETCVSDFKKNTQAYVDIVNKALKGKKTS